MIYFNVMLRLFVASMLLLQIFYTNQNNENDFIDLINCLGNKDPEKRVDVSKKLINMWQNDKVIGFIQQELSKEKDIYDIDTLIRLKDICNKIQFRRELGKHLVDALGDRVDLMITWSLKELIDFIRCLRKTAPTHSDIVDLQSKYAEWLIKRLKNKDDKADFIETISGYEWFSNIIPTPVLTNAANFIVRFLKDEDHYIRVHSIGILGMIKAIDCAKDVISLLQDKHIEIRSGVLKTIGLLSLQQYAKEVANHLKDPSNYVKYVAIETLIELNAREFAEEVAKFISFDLNLENNCELACSDSEYLEKLYNNSNKILFIHKAIEFVKKVGAKEYIPKIEELLSSQKIELPSKVEILEALLELDYKEKYIDEAADFIKQGATFAVRVLGTYRSKRYGDLISSCLNDKESSVRNLAIEAFVQLSDKQYAPDLAKLLLDNECAEPAAEALKTLNAISESKQYLALIRKQYLHSEDVFMKLTGLAVADILDLRELTSDIEKLVDDVSGYQNIYCSLDKPCQVENISVGGRAKKLLNRWKNK
ncbi:MAG: HEAT repeat domain-containing protein [Planctomycetes bacterium]|nr:HEAT repeat domain-containing protein [Planctomycetota bacterium]